MAVRAVLGWVAFGVSLIEGWLFEAVSQWAARRRRAAARARGRCESADLERVHAVRAKAEHVAVALQQRVADWRRLERQRVELLRLRCGPVRDAVVEGSFGLVLRALSDAEADITRLARLQERLQRMEASLRATAEVARARRLCMRVGLSSVERLCAAAEDAVVVAEAEAEADGVVRARR